MLRECTVYNVEIRCVNVQPPFSRQMIYDVEIRCVNVWSPFSRQKSSVVSQRSFVVALPGSAKKCRKLISRKESMRVSNSFGVVRREMCEQSWCMRNIGIGHSTNNCLKLNHF
jgi:hypothetical protein